MKAILHIEVSNDDYDNMLHDSRVKSLLIENLMDSIVGKFKDCLNDTAQGKSSEYLKFVIEEKPK